MKVRGGSWSEGSFYAVLKGFIRNQPAKLYDHGGFRVVRQPDLRTSRVFRGGSWDSFRIDPWVSAEHVRGLHSRKAGIRLVRVRS